MLPLNDDKAMVSQLQESIRQLRRGEFDIDKRKRLLLQKLDQVRQGQNGNSAPKKKSPLSGLWEKLGRACR